MVGGTKFVKRNVEEGVEVGEGRMAAQQNDEEDDAGDEVESVLIV